MTITSYFSQNNPPYKNEDYLMLTKINRDSTFSTYTDNITFRELNPSNFSQQIKDQLMNLNYQRNLFAEKKKFSAARKCAESIKYLTLLANAAPQLIPIKSKPLPPQFVISYIDPENPGSLQTENA